MKVRYDRVVHPEYTDTCVVVGPDVRWIEDDVEDLLQYRPEVLLGYRVKMVTAADAYRAARGQRVTKVVVLDAEYTTIGLRGIEELVRSTHVEYFGKVERWFVHRGIGIWRSR